MLAIANARGLGAATGAAAGAGLLGVPPAALAQQVALPVVLALGLLAFMLKQGAALVDKPQLACELSVPWH